MKNALMLIIVFLSAISASAAPSTYIKCSNQVNEIIALSRDIGREIEARSAAGLNSANSSDYLDDLDNQIFKSEMEISRLRSLFESCLKK